ncbi:MAG: hypothetical protein JNM85_03520 [Chthonomonas sp.]|nr:hypothetical protein [Chthonomonas sp.]
MVIRAREEQRRHPQQHTPEDPQDVVELHADEEPETAVHLIFGPDASPGHLDISA